MIRAKIARLWLSYKLRRSFCLQLYNLEKVCQFSSVDQFATQFIAHRVGEMGEEGGMSGGVLAYTTQFVAFHKPSQCVGSFSLQVYDCELFSTQNILSEDEVEFRLKKIALTWFPMKCSRQKKGLPFFFRFQEGSIVVLFFIYLIYFQVHSRNGASFFSAVRLLNSLLCAICGVCEGVSDSSCQKELRLDRRILVGPVDYFKCLFWCYIFVYKRLYKFISIFLLRS